jgi:hypothetical protein
LDRPGIEARPPHLEAVLTRDIDGAVQVTNSYILTINTDVANIPAEIVKMNHYDVLEFNASTPFKPLHIRWQY